MAGGEPEQGVHPCLVVPGRLPYPICQKRRRIAVPLCRLPWPERRNHQEPVPPPATARNADATLEGLILHHPGHPWCLQPGTDGRGGGMENSFPDTVWPF